MGRRVRVGYSPRHRLGDHVCYISDLRKLRAHCPEWGITRSLPQIVGEMVAAEEHRRRRARARATAAPLGAPAELSSPP
ncbi:MAG TPA: hypothetical protein VFY16_05955 [Gemmatimonadaceae bacterium]|nr:hypothetical protein [Gemmatimonadaceae bacterium]